MARLFGREESTLNRGVARLEEELLRNRHLARELEDLAAQLGNA